MPATTRCAPSQGAVREPVRPAHLHGRLRWCGRRRRRGRLAGRSRCPNRCGRRRGTPGRSPALGQGVVREPARPAALHGAHRERSRQPGRRGPRRGVVRLDVARDGPFGDADGVPGDPAPHRPVPCRPGVGQRSRRLRATSVRRVPRAHLGRRRGVRVDGTPAGTRQHGAHRPRRLTSPPRYVAATGGASGCAQRATRRNPTA